MLETFSLAPELRQPIETYFSSRKLPREELDHNLAELQVLAGDSALLDGDYAMSFAMSVIQLRVLEGKVPPALLLFEIVDIAQFGLAYFHDERTLNEMVTTIRECLE